MTPSRGRFDSIPILFESLFDKITDDAYTIRAYPDAFMTLPPRLTPKHASANRETGAAAAAIPANFKSDERSVVSQTNGVKLLIYSSFSSNANNSLFSTCCLRDWGKESER
jgi:hypothetical protein